ncbi:MAG TPA: glyoxalase/bleomycin resistance/dioxygenase family protein, partial [Rhizomicrobium sp.]|nr:glyoxalase/bleomycin resistance/dioxygenase family protein [Rhizomicrobium sp.]
RDQEAASCCYAQSHKSWITDPSGLRWESFYTFGEATTYGEDGVPTMDAPKAACCAPSPSGKACC